jgi:hypothetical protein
MKKDALTVKELAAELRMSPKSIQRAYRKEEIPVQWLGRDRGLDGLSGLSRLFGLSCWPDRKTNQKCQRDQRNQINQMNKSHGLAESRWGEQLRPPLNWPWRSRGASHVPSFEGR